MSFGKIINSIISYYQANPIIAIAVGIIIVFLLWRKPKLFFLTLLISLLLAGVLYLIMDISTTGVSQKEKLLHKEKGYIP